MLPLAVLRASLGVPRAALPLVMGIDASSVTRMIHRLRIKTQLGELSAITALVMSTDC